MADISWETSAQSERWLSSTAAGILQENQINAMVADALASCIARSSTASVLNLLN